MFEIMFCSGPEDGKRIKIEKKETTFGRLPGKNNIPISYDSAVSREHAVLMVEGEKLFLEDKGSTNGTYIGEEEKKIIGRIEITPGSIFRIGYIWFKIQKSQDVMRV